MNIITVEKRNEKSKAKQLRRTGFVPCIIYGGDLNESIPVQIEKQTANKLLRLKRLGSKIRIKLGEQVITAQIKDKTINFLNNEIQHISFQALKHDRRVNSVAHIILENSEKVKGMLERMLLEIPYSAFPEDMIDTVSLDLDGLPIGSVLTVGDIPLFKSDKIDLQVDLDSVVVRTSDRSQTSN